MKINNVREDFPFFKENPTLSYLDSAATTQKPSFVLDSIYEFYTKYNANANRGAYDIAQKATDILESSRQKVQNFIDADSSDEIIFTKSATEALNLFSYSYGLNNLSKDDEVLVSIAEHHANFVNWQYICNKTGAKLKIFYLDDETNLDFEDFKNKLSDKTKIVAITAQSNVLNFKVYIKAYVEYAHQFGAVTIVDGSQIISHNRVSMKDLDCDFFAFSGHKMYSLQGVGVLYGKRELLNNMDPFLLGGDMVEYVTEKQTKYKEIPHKFEAGTLDVSAIYSLKKAIEYLENIGFENIKKIENDLMKYLVNEIKKLDFVDLVYKGEEFSGALVAFNVKNVHPHDVSQILDYYNVAIRVGHHCSHQLHRYIGINSSCRASLSFYNTKEDIDKLIFGLKKVKEIFYGN